MASFRASAWAIGLALSLLGHVAVRAESASDRGRYLVTLMHCGGCHTTGSPMMPWRAYSQATDADLEAIAEYLKSVPAVKNEVPGPTAVADVKTLYFTAVKPGQ